MNIGVNTRILLKNRMEGVCRYTHETLSRMVAAHPEDKFFFFFDRPYDESFVYADNVTAIVAGPQARHPFLWYLWFERTIPKLLKKYEIDVFLSPDTYLSLSTKVPTVLVSHDIAYAHYPEHIPYLTRKYYQKYFPQFHHRAKRIVAVSNATKKDIVKTYKLDPEKIEIGYNAAPPHFKPLSKKEIGSFRDTHTEGKPYFIYVGAVHPRKNVHTIIKSFDIFKKNTSSDYKLVIIGRNAWKNNNFQQTLKKSKYRSDIICLQDFIEDVSPYIASSYALIYISLFEGFGIPILEAMKCDIPVICSNVSSMPEVAGNAALLVNPHNTHEVSATMTYLLNEHVRSELIELGRVQREKFSWNRTAEIIYDQLYLALKD